jgi:hypothetical protein
MVTNISKQTLKAKKQLLQDKVDEETQKISNLQIQIDALKATKQIYVEAKAQYQSEIADINTDIGE